MGRWLNDQPPDSRSLAAFLIAERLSMRQGWIVDLWWVQFERDWMSWIGSGEDLAAAVADARQRYEEYAGAN